MTRRSAIVKHQFVPSGRRSFGDRICTCGSLEKDAVHKLPEVDEGWKAAEARKLGERE